MTEGNDVGGQGAGCPWRIRWTFGADADCTKASHVRDVLVMPEPGQRFSVHYEGDPEHVAKLANGTKIRWAAGDRREFTGPHPGLCGVTPHCTLHVQHHGRCAI